MTTRSPCRRLLWFFYSFKMFHFRTILINTGLFCLGILTTLIVIANREDQTIDLCDFTPSTLSSNPSLDSYVLSNANGNNHKSNNQNDQLNQENLSFNPDTNLIIGNNNERLKSSLVLPTANSFGFSHNENGNENYADASINVNNLQLPFSSSVTKNNLIYVITPTYNRPEQLPELTRIAQALLQVTRIIHWVVVEDVERQTPGLDRFLNRFNLNYLILKSVKPKIFNKVVGKPRGVGARRAALEYLRTNQKKGIVYFADDDNTYDSEIFRQIQRTKKVSMWPVGLVTDLGVSSPIVRDGKVIGFYDGWKAYRKFPVDMAGFAINLKLLHEKKSANMPWVAGYEEDALLRSLGITLNDIQPLARNCTEILVWHSKSIKFNWSKKSPSLKPGLEVSTNLEILLKKLPQPHNGINNNHNTKLGNNDNSADSTNNGFSFLNMIFGNK